MCGVVWGGVVCVHGSCVVWCVCLVVVCVVWCVCLVVVVWTGRWGGGAAVSLTRYVERPHNNMEE